jgi:hypothetical protein
MCMNLNLRNYNEISAHKMFLGLQSFVFYRFWDYRFQENVFEFYSKTKYMVEEDIPTRMNSLHNE